MRRASTILAVLALTCASVDAQLEHHNLHRGSRSRKVAAKGAPSPPSLIEAARRAQRPPAGEGVAGSTSDVEAPRPTPPFDERELRFRAVLAYADACAESAAKDDSPPESYEFVVEADDGDALDVPERIGPFRVRHLSAEQEVAAFRVDRTQVPILRLGAVGTEGERVYVRMQIVVARERESGITLDVVGFCSVGFEYSGESSDYVVVGVWFGGL